MGSSHSYLVNLETGTVTSIDTKAAGTKIGTITTPQPAAEHTTVVIGTKGVAKTNTGSTITNVHTGHLGKHIGKIHTPKGERKEFGVPSGGLPLLMML